MARARFSRVTCPRCGQRVAARLDDRERWVPTSHPCPHGAACGVGAVNLFDPAARACDECADQLRLPTL